MPYTGHENIAINMINHSFDTSVRIMSRNIGKLQGSASQMVNFFDLSKIWTDQTLKTQIAMDYQATIFFLRSDEKE